MKFQLQLGPRPLNLAAEDFRLLQYVQVALYILVLQRPQYSGDGIDVSL